MQLDVTLHANELLDLENASEAYELRGRPSILFDPKDATTGRYEITDRIESGHWEASVVTIADDRRHIRLVVLDDTRNYNQFGVNDVELDLFPIFMDPTYDIACEGIERYFKIVSTHINMQEYRQARSHGQYLRIVAEYNDPQHNPETPLAVLHQRNDGQNLYFSLLLPSIMFRSHPAVTAAHRAPLAPLLTPLSTLANPSQWRAVLAGFVNQFTMIKGVAAVQMSLTLAESISMACSINRLFQSVHHDQRHSYNSDASHTRHFHASVPRKPSRQREAAKCGQEDPVPRSHQSSCRHGASNNYKALPSPQFASAILSSVQ